MNALRNLFDADNWGEILATLGRNKTRTFLTAFGIFWGTTMLALLSGGANGMQGMIERNFEGFATNMGVVMPGSRSISYQGFNKGSTLELNDRDVELMRQYVPEIVASTKTQTVWSTMVYKDKTKSAALSGVEAGSFEINLPILYSGRLINDNDVRTSARVGLIGKDLATELFGDEDPLGKYVEAGGLSIKVVGVVGQLAEKVNIGSRLDNSVTIPFTTLRKAYNLGDRVDVLLFTIKDGERVANAKDAIFRAVRTHHPIHPDDTQAIDLWDVSEMFGQIEALFLAIALLAFFVGGGTLIAGAIGVGNIMWIIVKERTQEIGIRRAIGARPADIIVQTLSEGLVLTAVAGLSGITFATLVLAVADHITTDPLHGAPGFTLSLSGAGTIVIVFVILGILASIVPSLKTMKIKPVEAINDK